MEEKTKRMHIFCIALPRIGRFLPGFCRISESEMGLFPAPIAGDFPLAGAFFAKRKVFGGVFLRMEDAPGLENLAIVRRKTPDDNGAMNFRVP